MKTKFLFLYILIFLNLTCFAQEKSFFLELSSGVSIPIGKYGDGDGEYHKTGYAKSGFNYGLLGYYKIPDFKNMSVAISTNYFTHDINSNALENSYRRSNYFTYTHAWQKPNWEIYSLSSGLIYSLSYNEKLDFHFTGLIGLAKATKPGFNLAHNYWGINNTVFPDFYYDIDKYYSNVESNLSLSLSTKLKIHWNVFNRWSLVTNIDFYFTKLKFEEDITVYDTGDHWSNATSYTLNVEDQNVSLINISLGVGYQF